jgi:hypothetical protein
VTTVQAAAARSFFSFACCLRTNAARFAAEVTFAKYARRFAAMRLLYAFAAATRAAFSPDGSPGRDALRHGR